MLVFERAQRTGQPSNQLSFALASPSNQLSLAQTIGQLGAPSNQLSSRPLQRL
jgi:hypothetical protein